MSAWSTPTFPATQPETVIERLVLEPVRAAKKHKKGPGLAPKFSFKDVEMVFDEIIVKEKASIQKKQDGIHDKMVEKGLDKLVVEFPSKVSSEDQVAKALYGKYLRTDG